MRTSLCLIIENTSNVNRNGARSFVFVNVSVLGSPQALESTGDLGLQLKELPHGVSTSGGEAGTATSDKVRSKERYTGCTAFDVQARLDFAGIATKTLIVC